MKCIHCGADIPDTAVFCTNCGQKLTTDSSQERPEETAEPMPTEEKVSGGEGAEEVPAEVPETTEGPIEGVELPEPSADASPEDAEALEQAGTDQTVPPVAGTAGEKKKIPVIPLVIAGIVILVIVLVVALHNGGSGDDSSDYTSSPAITYNPYVEMVKGGHPNSYPNRTYGEAFGSFFSSPRWSYFESDDGKDVVEFTGYCLYQNTEVQARFQFVLDVGNGTFETAYFAFNDVPQTKLMLSALLEKVFTS